MKQPSTLSPAKQALLEQRLKRASQVALQRVREIPVRPDRDSAPLSFTQRQIWVIDRITPGNPAYNMPYGYRIQGTLNVAALEASFNEVIKRHEALRTTFAANDGEPVQCIHPALTININFTELDHLSDPERDDRLQALASEESVKPFDLSRLPLVRVSLFKLDAADHVLVVNLHHIVADGLSIGLLWNELDIFYRAFTGGSAPRPPELAVQYGDFALWQRETAANETAYAKQIEFWRKQLVGNLPVLELPADKPRPPLQSFTGSNVFFTLPTALAQRVKSLGEGEGCTFFMTVLAAFQALLHRYTGAADFVIGTPVARRTPDEVEPLIGLILNMVALRCDLSGDQNFIQLLRRTRDATLDAFSNSEVPFEAVLKELQFERDASRNPVFQVVLQVLANTPPKVGDLEISSFHFDLKFAQFDLTLHLYEEGGSYQGRFEYCTDLFEAETIRRLCEHFANLLEAIVREPEQRISKLPLLTDAERQQVLVDWNRATAEYPRNSSVHEVFEAQARRTPDAVAVEYQGLRLSYRELNSRANRLAHYLRRHGIGREKRVAICLDRSLELVVGLLGILKAGGAYVPLDPSYPNERLRFMLDDPGATVLLTQQAFVEKLPHHSARVICLDRDWEEIAKQSEENPENEVTADNLAYVIYTSGSTGTPKGVEVPHRGILRLLFGVDYARFDASQTFLHLAPISFDAATFEVWGALLHGGRCVLYPGRISSPRELGEVLHKHDVSILWLTSSLFNAVIDEAPEALSGVRQLLIGGEALSVPHVRRALSRLPQTEIINGYGPTESTTFTCCYPIPRALDDGLTSIPIGRPIGNTQVYLLDAHLEPVPIGVAGELYIGGDGLARGYLGDPELTAEKFITHPFSTVPGSRLYRTGDLARYRRDGSIEFLGRIDTQVKLRGFRIELGEIEAILGHHPAVRDALVLARGATSTNGTDKRLVAYLVTGQEPAPSVDELRGFLGEKLPEYMIPSGFVFLDSLPLTPNGKVDRKALPVPDWKRPDSQKIVEPRDETETILCQLWAAVLKIDRVGIDDNFFALGGHSLLAAKLFARLDETFGRSLPLGILFATPTVRALADHYRAPQERHFRSIVALRAGGSLPPIHAVPGVYGNVLGFADLSRELGPDQPFYALQSVGLDGKEPPLESIEVMAQLYIDEIRSVQPRGPYALVGACFGATVTYEIARQLLADGETVALLGLLDPTPREGTKTGTAAPQRLRRMAAMASFLSARLRLYLDEIRACKGADRIKYVTGKMCALVRFVSDDRAAHGVQRELHQLEVYRANLRALDRYQRHPLVGPLAALEIFETARNYEPNTSERPLDWNEWWQGPMARHRVPGKDSGDMLSGRNAAVLATHLRKRLSAAFSRMD